MVKTAETYHVPVLLKASVDGLDITPNGTYVDVTFGGGGHSREILSRLGPGGRLFGFDQDADAENNVRTLFPQAPEAANGEQPGDGEAANRPTFTFVRSNFRYLKNWMRYHNVDHIDGLLGDLGVSSHHFDDEERGFSFRFDAPLDMRMNGRGGMTAAEVLNRYDEEALANLFYLYGELKNSRRIASAIVKARQQQPMTTIADLLAVAKPLMPREREKKDLARVFQALRIEVNHEMDALQEMLQAALKVLRPGGRLVVLTYHSLEDRLVKNFIKSGRMDGKVQQDFYGRRLTPWRAVNNKVIVPSAEEQEANPRSRSAKLRIAEKAPVEAPHSEAR